MDFSTISESSAIHSIHNSITTMDLDKKFYRIGDVAELLDLPQSTLRFWENHIPEVRPRRTSGGSRMYSPADIERMRIIKYLIKDKGLKIEAAREHLRKNRKDIEKTHEVITRLQDVRRKLEGLLEALDHRPKVS